MPYQRDHPGIVAGYPGTCARCHRPYPKGARVRRSPDHSWEHVACDSAPAAAVPAEPVYTPSADPWANPGPASPAPARPARCAVCGRSPVWEVGRPGIGRVALCEPCSPPGLSEDNLRHWLDLANAA
jgi:hypothetical protein